MNINKFYFFAFLLLTIIMVIFDIFMIIEFIDTINGMKSFESVRNWLEEYIGTFKEGPYTRGAWYLFISFAQILILIVCIKYIIKYYKK